MQSQSVQHHASAPPPPPALPRLDSDTGLRAPGKKVFARPKLYDPNLAFKAHQEHTRRQELIGVAENFAKHQRKNLKSDLGFSDDSSDDEESKQVVVERVRDTKARKGSMQSTESQYRQPCESCQAMCFGKLCAYCEDVSDSDSNVLEDGGLVLKEEYELLQQRYLTTLKGVHEMGERERSSLSLLADMKRASKTRVLMVQKNFVKKLEQQCDMLEEVTQTLSECYKAQQNLAEFTLSPSTLAEFQSSCDEQREELTRMKKNIDSSLLESETVSSTVSGIDEAVKTENRLLRDGLADLVNGKAMLKEPSGLQASVTQTPSLGDSDTGVKEGGTENDPDQSAVDRTKLAKAIKIAKVAKARYSESKREKEEILKLLHEAQEALRVARGENGETGNDSKLDPNTNDDIDVSNAKLSEKVRNKFKKLKMKLVESESERKKAIGLVREMAGQLRSIQAENLTTNNANDGSIDDNKQHREEEEELSVRKEMNHQEETARLELEITHLKTLNKSLEEKLRREKGNHEETEAQRRKQSEMNKKIEDLNQSSIKYKERSRKATEKLKLQRACIVKLAQQIKLEKQSMVGLKSEFQTMLNSFQSIQSKSWNAVSSKIIREGKALEGIVAKYDREVKARKRLFNLVQELRGNIRVFCRIRPVTSGEVGSDSRVITRFPDEDSIALINSKGREKKWEFDKILLPHLSNESIFEEVKDHCVSILDGYNVCIFAYGQTGSGKTYTMEGPEHDRGINHRALRKLFQDMKHKSEVDQEWEYNVQVSFLEIYNEQVRDLLAKQGGPERKMEVKQGPHGMYVPDLTMMDVEDHEQVGNLMALGHKNRATACTNMNDRSSRSHSMLSTYIVARNRITGQVNRGKLHLIDLAGSERLNKSGATGMRMIEAQNINKSLSALGDVIQARANKAAHVPYRNSTLTYLLQDSLSQDSKTLMVVQVSPVSGNAEESFCSLNFASRVRKVELGTAKKNISSG